MSLIICHRNNLFGKGITPQSAFDDLKDRQRRLHLKGHPNMDGKIYYNECLFYKIEQPLLIEEVDIAVTAKVLIIKERWCTCV